MSTGHHKVTRADRVASLELPPGKWRLIWRALRSREVALRVGLCVVATIVMWAVTAAWAPPFAFRTGYVPRRDVTARTSFEMRDQDRENQIIQQRRAATICYYENNVQPLIQIQQSLKDKVFHIVAADSYQKVDETTWGEFYPQADVGSNQKNERAFGDFQAAFADDEELLEFENTIRRAFADFEKNGLLAKLEHAAEDGDQRTIYVHPLGNDKTKHTVNVEEVRIPEIRENDYVEMVREAFRTSRFPESLRDHAAELTCSWLRRQAFPLPATLHLNQEATAKSYADGRRDLDATIIYEPGTRLVKAGTPLTVEDLEKLKAEHMACVRKMSLAQRFSYSLADMGMYVAMYVLCGVYMLFYERKILSEFRQLSTLLGLVVGTVSACWLAADDSWRVEIVPLVLFGMILAIAYRRELALLVSASVSLVVVLSLGRGLAEFVIVVAAVSSAILMLGRVRSRTKLIYVGFGAGLVAFATTVGVGTLVGQAFGTSSEQLLPSGTIEPAIRVWHAASLLTGAAINGFCTLLAGFLITGLLPFVEKLFDVQTDLSLLELGDAAHPLLQELAQRAPGTYNHSINVASLGEAAAEAIGANGLLVRVGAYFHDIGKMLKPVYFVENQEKNANQHDQLVPAMSTLVIIAHVKDGADLARQHSLPKAIVDFVEQHHGTTLVEYFYRRAEQRSEADPDGDQVDEMSFRYPGPKPQTKEAGVMMLADALESASRTLVDPAPSRIESLVSELSMKRLLDGQFAECGLTLQELQVIEDSLVKSLTSVYHGRVKYPDQSQTA